ncbi:hypothetical protein SAMN02787144_102513 [Streptomyces atratus]|uniref:Uncharacterized protein n=2 Tax=Streptomyces atratus TaxID=1893 RepID=A0A1K2EXX2_STRAR|nr:hypothetical protein SAMN02787144_102513 [Streptomyces atratus]
MRQRGKVRSGCRLPSVMTMSHPQSYEILLIPRFAEDTTEAEDTAEAEGTADTGEAAEPGGAVRSAVVSATGETGASGYPRYSGEGIVADIDPATHAVEALLVDGAELAFGLSARIKERDAEADADR